MATNGTIEVAHLVELAWDTRTWGRGVRAECSCGWSGDWRTDIAAASDDGVEHRDTAVGPGDGLDAVISTLLDVQDDLADAVVWLAENWSADLPVPTLRSGLGDVLVELSTYCTSADDMDRATNVVGVAPVDDLAPDSLGNRYRRATRRFGRVSLVLFRSLVSSCEECRADTADGTCLDCGQRADARTAQMGAA